MAENKKKQSALDLGSLPTGEPQEEQLQEEQLDKVSGGSFRITQL